MKDRTSTTGEPVKAVHIGYQFTHPTLGNVIVERIHHLGTIDVRNVFTDRWYRLSGLAIVAALGNDRRCNPASNYGDNAPMCSECGATGQHYAICSQSE